jgi:membrane protein implicated in regulation of membrane protease activity
MTLIAFYHAFPATWITASWIIAAILFFLLGILIKNIKYRWLAIAAMVATAIRLVFVDMSSINIGYRVLVFLSLAVISISLSVVYTKFYIRKKKDL